MEEKELKVLKLDEMTNLMWIILVISGVFGFMVNWFINEDLSEDQRLKT